MENQAFKLNTEKHLNTNPLMRHVLERFNKDIVSIVARLSPQKTLDAGCGEGFTTIAVGRRFPEASITAIDIGQEQIDYAQKNHSLKNIKYSQGDLYNLPFKEGSFDLVMCNEVLEHLEDYATALNKLMELSNKYLLVSVPNEPWFRIMSLLRLKYLPTWGNHPDHVNNWTASQFRKMISQHGQILRFKRSSVWNIALLRKF